MGNESFSCQSVVEPLRALLRMLGEGASWSKAKWRRLELVAGMVARAGRGMKGEQDQRERAGGQSENGRDAGRIGWSSHFQDSLWQILMEWVLGTWHCHFSLIWCTRGFGWTEPKEGVWTFPEAQAGCHSGSGTCALLCVHPAPLDRLAAGALPLALLLVTSWELLIPTSSS